MKSRTYLGIPSTSKHMMRPALSYTMVATWPPLILILRSIAPFRHPCRPRYGFVYAAVISRFIPSAAFLNRHPDQPDRRLARPHTFLRIDMGSFLSRNNADDERLNMSNNRRPLPDFAGFAYTGDASSSEGAELKSATKSSINTGVETKSSTGRRSSPRKRSTSAAAVATASPKKKTKRSPAKSKAAAKSPSTPKTPKTRKTTASSPTKSPSRRPRTPKIEPGSLDPPPDWERIWALVVELRQDRSAPVDTDGGHELPERNRGEIVWRFQVLMALMLSSQTKDAVVGKTMRSLQQHGCDVETINRTSVEEVNRLIQSVGFHNNKAKYIKQTCEILLERYDGDIPKTAKEMMELPGVGPKMAFIVENIVYGRSSGIGIDTHMHRMYNILGWVNSKTPEKTREQLEGWLPRDKWSEANVLWVGIGQETQQQKEKVIRKALICSRPGDALKLIKRLGVDLAKEGKKFGLESEIKTAMEHNDK